MLLFILVFGLHLTEVVHHNAAMSVAINKMSLNRYFSGKSREVLLDISPLKGNSICIYRDMISRPRSTTYAVEFEDESKPVQPGYIGEQDLTQIPLDELGSSISIEVPYSPREIRLRANNKRFRFSTSFVFCGTGNEIDVATPWYRTR